MIQKNFLTLPARFISADGTRPSLLAYCLLLLVCIGFFLPGIASLPVTDRDEAFFAQASKQMVETQNYVDIRFREEPRYKKPIGIYWLQSLSVQLLNPHHLDQIWAYRVPSFIAATVAVVLTASIGAMLFDPIIGIIAALMIASCLILNVEARIAKTDATLLASIMVMQFGLVRAYVQNKLSEIKTANPCSLFVVLSFWFALGIGILIKGPIIVLVLASTLLWLRVKNKNLAWFAALKPMRGLCITALITLPWLVAIGLSSHGNFFQQSAGHDLFGKILQGEYRGLLPPGLHALVFPAIFFPFSLFAVLAIPDVIKNRMHPSVAFCLGWIIPTWIVFEISLTKLPHYVLPTYPAIAILTAKMLSDRLPALNEKRWLPPLAFGIWLAMGTVIALLPIGLTFLLNQSFSVVQIMASGILLVLIYASLFFIFRRSAVSIALIALGMMIFNAVLFTDSLPNVQHVWLSREVVAKAKQVKLCPELRIVSGSYGEPSLIFNAGTLTKTPPDGRLAAYYLIADPCAVAATDNEHDWRFHQGFKYIGYKPDLVGEVDGYNAGKGNTLKLRLYTLKKPPSLFER
jgi:4-amino-4-deoxy-L-arabinose transferase-like glycosyltransferase